MTAISSKIKIFLLVMLASFSLQVFAVELREFKDAKEEQRFNALAKELRCLVCQNQSLADSDAELAKDLRNQIHLMLQEGSSNQEISDYMVERYGDFILYNPPVKDTTILLWFGPFIFVSLAAALLIFYLIKRTESKVPDIASVEDRKKQIQVMMADLEKNEAAQKKNKNKAD
jgi:cytochrome c-type biogenesis protein CcmH